MRFAPGLLLSVTLGATCMCAALVHAAPDAGANLGTPKQGEADPWATMRGCISVLDKVVACGSDKKFAALRARWMAAAPNRRARAAVEDRLRGWAKRDGRRAQCALWARRAGAAEHVGESANLAQMASATATRCVAFGRALDKDGWLPKALIDFEQD